MTASLRDCYRPKAEVHREPLVGPLRTNSGHLSVSVNTRLNSGSIFNGFDRKSAIRFCAMIGLLRLAADQQWQPLGFTGVSHTMVATITLIAHR